MKLGESWKVDLTSSNTYGSSLLNAKRSCLILDNCFGIRVGVKGGDAYSITYPIQLSVGGDWNIYKKEELWGILVIKNVEKMNIVKDSLFIVKINRIEIPFPDKSFQYLSYICYRLS